MSLKIGPAEAQKIRNRMDELGLTQKQLADQLGISERHLRSILSIRQGHNPGLKKDKLEDLMAILGVGLDTIFDKNSYEDNTKYNNFYSGLMKPDTSR